MPAPFKVLFLCTGNCCRSQMAEAILRHLGGDRFEVFSAGSDPAGYVHPLAIQALAVMGISTDEQHSKSWDTFADRELDVVITLCDSAAAKPHPRWQGQPVIAHWSLPDPSFASGSDQARLQMAVAVALHARQWIEELIALPLETLSPDQLRAELEAIGQD